jgi:hypothetical protein
MRTKALLVAVIAVNLVPYPAASGQQETRPFTARIEPRTLPRGQTTIIHVVGQNLPQFQRVTIFPPFGVTIVEIKPAGIRADGLEDVAIVVSVEAGAGPGERALYAVTPGWEFELTKVLITTAGAPAGAASGTAAGEIQQGGAKPTESTTAGGATTSGRTPLALSAADAEAAIVRYCATLPDGVVGSFKDMCFRKDEKGYPGELIVQCIEEKSAKYYQRRDAGNINGAPAWFGGSAGSTTVVWSRGGRFFLAFGSIPAKGAPGDADRVGREQTVALDHAKKLDAMLVR